mgnify:CR=1 FL=1
MRIALVIAALHCVRGRFNAPPLRQCEGALRPFQGTQRDDESAIGSTLAAIGGLVERVYVLCARRCERTPELAPSAWRHAFVVDGLRYDRCARLDGATRQQSRATLTHLAVLQDARESLALNATVLVLEDDAVATAAPPWSRARLEEFDATVLRAAGWLSVRLGWGFGGERAPGTTWSRDDGRGCACACDVSQRPWCALGRDCLVWSSVAYLASAGRTFDAWAALEDAPPNFIVVGHIDRVAAAFSKVVVVPALAEQSGEAPAAWPAPPNSCAPEGPTSVPPPVPRPTAGSTASNATASDAPLARLAALRAAGSLSAAEFAHAQEIVRNGNNRRPRRRLAAAAGVLYAVWDRPGGTPDRYVRDVVASLTFTRRVAVQASRYPVFLAASSGDLLARLARAAAPAPWDDSGVVGVDPRIKARAAATEDNIWLWRLSAWLQSPFEATLSLDTDVLVLRPTFVHSLLALETDAAAPVDPARYFAHSTWGADASAAPPFCACVLRLTKSPLVEAWLLGAADRLATKRHAHVRQGDQEMLWYEWQENLAGRLRLLILPEDYYCPNVPLSAARPPTWNTSWHGWNSRGAYACRAVHGHRQSEVTRARVAYCLGLDEAAFRRQCADTTARPPDRVVHRR